MKTMLYIFVLPFTVAVLISVMDTRAQSGWFQQNSGTTATLRGVSFTDANIGTVVGDSGTILRTIDGGKTWSPQTSGTTNNLQAVVFVDDNIGTAVGEFSTILRTTDGGLNWTNQSSPVYRHLASVSFVDADHGIIVGSNGCILRTTNGGALWTSHSLFSDNQLYDVSLIDSSIGIAVGTRWMWHPGGYYTYVSIIMGTSDGGNTWIERYLDYSHMCFTAIAFRSNSGTAVGGGGPMVMARSTDFGNTWFNIYSNYGGCPTDLIYPDSNTGILVGCYGMIFHTTDGGSSWATQLSGTTEDLFGVYFTDALTGTIVGENGIILRTLDGGIPVELTSFTTEVSDNKVLLNWSTATETNNSGFEIQSKKSEDRSQELEWEKIGFVPGCGTITEPKSYSYVDDLSLNHNLPTGRQSLTLTYRLKQIDYDGSYEYSNEIEVDVDFTPEEFTLYQNYPNPFNPSTKIKFTISDFGFTSLKVYDVLGNEVATLVDEEKELGDYEIEFNGENLSSGIYYYELRAGNFSETKKLLLLR